GGVRREGVRRWGVRRWGRHGAGSPRRGAPVARPGAWRPVRLQARTAVTAPAPPPAPGTGVPGGQWAHGPAHAAPKRTRRPDAPVRRVPGTAAGWRAGRVSRGRSWAQDLGRGRTRDGPRRQDPTRRRDRTPRPGRALRRAPAWPRARPTV